MQLLKDLMGTRYITVDHVSKMIHVLESVDEVDMAYCRLTPNAEYVLTRFYSKVNFINSENSLCNGILQHNMKAARMEKISTVPLPDTIKSQEALLDTLRNFDMLPVYSLEDTKLVRRVKYAWAAVISMKYPEVKLDLGAEAREMFEQVRDNWLKVRQSHKSYWCVDRASICRIDVIDGKVCTLDNHVLAEDLFVQNYVCLPLEFGTKVVWEDPEYEYVIANALRIIQNFGTEVKIKTMKDFIEVVE